MPLVLLTETFTLAPDTLPELAVLIVPTLMGGMGKHDPPRLR